jgi:hypothetical protein
VTAFCTRHVSARWRDCLRKSVTIAANAARLTLPLALCVYGVDVQAGQDIDDAASLNLLIENDAFAATKGDELGRGYQTLINDALRASLTRHAIPVDAHTVRRIVREKLEKVR